LLNFSAREISIKHFAKTKEIFGITAELFPATDIRTHLSATTKDGRRIHTEETLDLALYSEPYGLKKIYVSPKNAPVNEKIITNIMQADIIISGRAIWYTQPTTRLVVPKIKEAFSKVQLKNLLF